MFLGKNRVNKIIRFYKNSHFPKQQKNVLINPTQSIPQQHPNMASIEESRKRARTGTSTQPQDEVALFNAAYTRITKDVHSKGGNMRAWIEAGAEETASRVELLAGFRAENDWAGYDQATAEGAAANAVLLGGRAVHVALVFFKNSDLDINNCKHREQVVQVAHRLQDIEPSIGWTWVAHFLNTTKAPYLSWPLDKMLAFVLLRNQCSEAAFLKANITQWPQAARINIADALLTGTATALKSGKDAVEFLRRVAGGLEDTDMVR